MHETEYAYIQYQLQRASNSVVQRKKKKKEQNKRSLIQDTETSRTCIQISIILCKISEGF